VPITAILELRLKPESVDAAPAVLQEVLAVTRAFEGCLSLEVLTDVTDPTHVTIVETWESMERDLAYRAFRQTPEGKSTLGTLLAGAPTLAKYSTLASL
jgi:quinol monooxygenase YgiN